MKHEFSILNFRFSIDKLNPFYKTFGLLTFTTLLLAGCQSYKKVPYLQDLGSQTAALAAVDSLYDARIQPKDLLTIVVSCPEAPELAEPFNLTVSTAYSNINRQSLTTQPVLQQYLVDNAGCVDFPVLGTIRLGGLTKGEAEQYIRERSARSSPRRPSSPSAWSTTRFPFWAKSPVPAPSPFPTRRSTSSRPLPWRAT